MAIAPRLVQRSAGLIDIAIPTRAGVASFAIGSNITLTTAWAGTTNFLASVPKNTWFKSPSLVRGGVGSYPDSMRGLTRVSFNPNDYASATMNGDTATQYITVQELDAAGGVLSTSPVLVVPPATFFATGRATLTLTGVPVTVAAGAAGFPPTGAGRLLLPMFSDEVTIYNTGGNDMFVSLGAGRQELTVPSAAQRSFTEAGAWDLWIRSTVATTFESTFSIVNGLQS